jgi:hypothetical protein
VEIVVAASVAQRALSGVGQRGDEVCPLRMPAGSRTGQGGLAMVRPGGGKEMHTGVSISEVRGKQGGGALETGFSIKICCGLVATDFDKL